MDITRHTTNANIILLKVALDEFEEPSLP